MGSSEYENTVDSLSFFEVLQTYYNDKFNIQNEVEEKDDEIFNTIDDKYKLDDINIIELINKIKNNDTEELTKTLLALLNKLISNLKDKCKKYFIFKNEHQYLNNFFTPDFNKNKIHNFENHIKQYMYTNINEKINSNQIDINNDDNNKINNYLRIPKHWRMRKNDKIKLEELLMNNNVYKKDI